MRLHQPRPGRGLSALLTILTLVLVPGLAACTSFSESATEESASTDEAPYGEGSHAPLADPAAPPEGFEIKGNADSMLYHTPDSRYYKVTKAEVWFDTEESAQAAGFSKPAAQTDDTENN